MCEIGVDYEARWLHMQKVTNDLHEALLRTLPFCKGREDQEDYQEAREWVENLYRKRVAEIDARAQRLKSLTHLVYSSSSRYHSITSSRFFLLLSGGKSLP